jgi:hypothetical protein
MTEDERWEYLNALDEELLTGGVILSEWCSMIVREADTAFVKGAHLAAILTAVAGIETHLRYELQTNSQERLVDLINRTAIPDELKQQLHELRAYRNKWVHIGEPWKDESILERPERYEKELEDMALVATRLLRMTIYANPWV